MAKHGNYTTEDPAVEHASNGAQACLVVKDASKASAEGIVEKALACKAYYRYTPPGSNEGTIFIVQWPDKPKQEALTYGQLELRVRQTQT